MLSISLFQEHLGFSFLKFWLKLKGEKDVPQVFSFKLSQTFRKWWENVIIWIGKGEMSGEKVLNNCIDRVLWLRVYAMCLTEKGKTQEERDWVEEISVSYNYDVFTS